MSFNKRALLVAGVALAVMLPVMAAASHQFTDVADDNIFHTDIGWLADADITRGCNPPDNTEFCPDDSVTRGQMAAFMRRFAQYLGAEDGTPAVADTAVTAGDSDTLDGLDSADFARAVDETGIVQSVEEQNAVTVVAADPLTVIEEVTIEAPSDGYVLVNAVSQVDAIHVLGSFTWANYGVSASNTTLPNNQDVVILVDTTLPSGRYNWPAAAHGVFPVSAGSNTFYLLIDQVGGGAGTSFDVWDVGLSALFVPNSYGTVAVATGAAELSTTAGETE